MFYLLAFILAFLDPTAFAFGLMFSVVCTMLALGFFYVNARVVFMVFLIAIMRLVIQTFILPDFGLPAESMPIFININSVFKWLDIIMGVAYGVLILLGMVNGRPLTGPSLYEIIQHRIKKSKEKGK